MNPFVVFVRHGDPVVSTAHSSHGLPRTGADLGDAAEFLVELFAESITSVPGHGVAEKILGNRESYDCQ